MRMRPRRKYRKSGKESCLQIKSDEVINTLQKSIAVTVGRTTKEVIVQNIQMIVE